MGQACSMSAPCLDFHPLANGIPQHSSTRLQGANLRKGSGSVVSRFPWALGTAEEACASSEEGFARIGRSALPTTLNWIGPSRTDLLWLRHHIRSARRFCALPGVSSSLLHRSHLASLDPSACTALHSLLVRQSQCAFARSGFRAFEDDAALEPFCTELCRSRGYEIRAWPALALVTGTTCFGPWAPRPTSKLGKAARPCSYAAVHACDCMCLRCACSAASTAVSFTSCISWPSLGVRNCETKPV